MVSVTVEITIVLLTLARVLTLYSFTMIIYDISAMLILHNYAKFE